MATVSLPTGNVSQETAEERFQRILRESKDFMPEEIGSPEEIKRDALATFKSWSKLRRRAKTA